MEPFDIGKISNALENNLLFFLNLKRIFLARSLFPRTAEFSPCRSPPPGNSENMTNGRGVLWAHPETRYFRAWK